MPYIRRDEMYTSIAVKVNVHRRAKELAEEKGIPMKDFIEYLLNKLIKEENHESS